MSKNYLVAAFFLCLQMDSTAGLAEELLPAQELLDRSIAYHDPQGVWMTSSHRLLLSETRPNGLARKTTVVIDNREGSFRMTRKNTLAPTRLSQWKRYISSH